VIRAATSLGRARAGLTLLEVLIAVGLTVVVATAALTAVVSFSRANARTSAAAELQRDALLVEEVVRLDLGRVSRDRTFVRQPDGAWAYRTATSTSTTLGLLNPNTSLPYDVTYSLASGILTRTESGVNAPTPGTRLILNVRSIFFSQLQNGQVVVSGFVAGSAADVAQQGVQFRVTGTVRMR
jgi:type II secretory pathway pseudopilin PulG